MRGHTYRRLVLLGSIVLFVFLCIPYHLDAQFDGKETLPSKAVFRTVTNEEEALLYEVGFSKEDLSFSKSDGYDSINLPDCVFTRDAGKPQLPFKVLHFIIDYNQEVDQVLLITDIKEEIPGEFNVYPAQESVRLDEKREFTPPDPSVYSSAIGYPEDRVEIKVQGSLGGANIVTVHVYPLEYMPAQKKLILHRHLRFKLLAKDKSRQDGRIRVESLNAAKIVSSKTQEGNSSVIKFLDRLVANPQDIKKRYQQPAKIRSFSLAAGEAVDYLIITSAALKKSEVFKPLIDSKVTRGLSVKTETVEAIETTYDGRDTQEKIRNCIKDYYTNNGLVWVLLGGDTDIVPDRSVATRMGDVLCDMYYSNLDGDWDANKDSIFGESSDEVDLLPDVFLGRAPVENEEEAKAFVNKILTYEKNIADYAYKVLLLGTAEFDNAGGTVNELIDEKYIPAEFDLITKYYRINIPAYRDQTIAAMNEGYYLVNHIDHAATDKLYTGFDFLTISDIDGLTNSRAPSVINSCGCWAAAIDVDCIAEHWVTNPNGGGVAFIGNSRAGANPESDTMLNPEFYKSLFKEKMTQLGVALMDSKLTFIGDIDNGDMKGALFELNLLGDPEMNLRIDGGGKERPPVLQHIGRKITKEGELLEFTIIATDVNGDSLTYSASNLPAGASFDPNTKTFSWRPGYSQTGTYSNVHFEVSDGLLTDSEDIAFRVGENRPPVFDPIGNKDAREGELSEFIITATDPDGDGLTYSASCLPLGARFNSSTRTFRWIPDYNQAGTYPGIVFTVDDGWDGSDSDEITITVKNVVSGNRAPVLALIGKKSVNAGELLEFSISATDYDADKLTFFTNWLPPGASFTVNKNEPGKIEATFSWTPTLEQANTSRWSAVFGVRDEHSLTDCEIVEITVNKNKDNQPPVLVPIGNKTVKAGEKLEFTLSATDLDGDTLFYLIRGALPPGATFRNGVFSWTPISAQVRTEPYYVTFFVRDSKQNEDSETIGITVTAAYNPPTSNQPPVLAPIGNKSVNESQTLRFTISATDQDGDTLRYSATGEPLSTGGATFSGQTFTWTPKSGQAGDYSITSIVSDGQADDSETIIITVTTTTPSPRPSPSPSPSPSPIPNQPPSLSFDRDISVEQAAYTGELFKLNLTAEDPEQEALTYVFTRLPQGAILKVSPRDPNKATFEFIPTIEQLDFSYRVEFRVWDGQAGCSKFVVIRVKAKPSPSPSPS